MVKVANPFINTL